MEVTELKILSQEDTYEVSGKIDFDALDRYFHQNSEALLTHPMGETNKSKF